MTDFTIVRVSRRLADGGLFRLGSAVKKADGWRFFSNVASHRGSRKFHPTFVACLPRWVGYPNRCETEYLGGDGQ
jgi:hypothetical protein